MNLVQNPPVLNPQYSRILIQTPKQTQMFLNQGPYIRPERGHVASQIVPSRQLFHSGSRQIPLGLGADRLGTELGSIREYTCCTVDS